VKAITAIPKLEQAEVAIHGTPAAESAAHALLTACQTTNAAIKGYAAG